MSATRENYSPEGWDRRMAVWRHNSLYGRAHAALSLLNAIVLADTTTVESKTLASGLHSLVQELAESLKKRADQT